jgi:hypothetical protein
MTFVQVYNLNVQLVQYISQNIVHIPLLRTFKCCDKTKTHMEVYKSSRKLRFSKQLTAYFNKAHNLIPALLKIVMKCSSCRNCKNSEHRYMLISLPDTILIYWRLFWSLNTMHHTAAQFTYAIAYKNLFCIAPQIPFSDPFVRKLKLFVMRIACLVRSFKT